MAKKEKIQELFDDIAPDYDYLNHLLSLDVDKSWRRKAVREIIDTDEPQKILDVACGTGDFTIAIARKAMMKHADNSCCHTAITGLDLSEGMLEIGRRKVSESGFRPDEDDECVRVNLVQGDCEALPFADRSFDRVSVGFGVRNFEHLEIGLQEIFRVLKPDGKLVILELSVPSNRLLRGLYKLYFIHILPLVGGKVSGNKGAYRYLPESVLKFPGPDKFRQMLHDAGFRSASHKALTFGICRMYTAVR
ncbi:MAG: bifunctional demethylmenaquinone methyltransferase/2-methoxy-6-polyprenyl-1,4-benzoquinol methylase UbiE [Candidatus Cryptobacteroides sp.]